MLAGVAFAAPPLGADLNSPLAMWYRSLNNAKGENCCSVADCRRPYAWTRIDDVYQVQMVAHTPWLRVPPENVLRRENEAGDAVACVVGGVVRCFVPVPET